MEPQTEVERYFHCRIAIIAVSPGETKEEAWSRHLLEHPEDAYADIKVFNQYSMAPIIPKKKKADGFYL